MPETSAPPTAMIASQAALWSSTAATQTAAKVIQTRPCTFDETILMPRMSQVP